VCRTRSGERLHLTPDRWTTLCDHVAIPVGVETSRKSSFPLAAPHWIDYPLLCQTCRRGRVVLLEAAGMLDRLRRGEDSRHAEEARAVTATRMAHLAQRRLIDTRRFTIDDLRHANPEARRKLKALANGKDAADVTPPSDRTWEIMLRLLDQPRPKHG
jgi:hypothetical protein